MCLLEDPKDQNLGASYEELLEAAHSYEALLEEARIT